MDASSMEYKFTSEMSFLKLTEVMLLDNQRQVVKGNGHENVSILSGGVKSLVEQMGLMLRIKTSSYNSGIVCEAAMIRSKTLGLTQAATSGLLRI